MPQRIIYLRTDAPPKPAEGRACNGCGVCCADEPCPAGQLVSGRRRGGCSALFWSDAEGRYRCGLLAQPERHLPRTLRWAAPMLARAARRLISAGSGCDSSVVAEVAPRG
ncbi:hypothetical protein [Caldimonas brevitalea]|uniref:Ferredoxin n=1 Tax=Caldimonas brevitalea TaxID=413882 RepID=A0A0G3BSH8_9BURK|nr:hypothetical protein [Caldimonas brevitalea]AKJ29505.1 ferredoxin [Caldimonas brevitalea]